MNETVECTGSLAGDRNGTLKMQDCKAQDRRLCSPCDLQLSAVFNFHDIQHRIFHSRCGDNAKDHA